MTNTITEHLACIPVMNAGSGQVASYDFKSGAKLQLGHPSTVWRFIPALSDRDDLSVSEVRHFEIARAWLFITSTEEPASIREPNNIFAITARLAAKLWSLRWCIDIAGCGENDHWRGGNNMHCAGVYVHSTRSPIPSAYRRHFVYSPPTGHQRQVPWSEDLLALADDLYEARVSYEGEPIPRLELANQLRYAMTYFNARRATTRFQLAITALETLFIAPTERLYLWCDESQQRIGSVCTDVPGLNADFFDEIRQRRNDAAHRGGLSTETGTLPKFVNLEAKTEDLLRSALRWAFRNQDAIAEAFDHNEWPPVA